MHSVSKWMPDPWALLKEFTKPFVYIVGGFAALTAFFHVLFGEDPVGPVLWFLSGSVEALTPLLVKLTYIWFFYSAIYLLVGVYLRDLWVLVLRPEEFTDVSIRRGLPSWCRRVLGWLIALISGRDLSPLNSRPQTHLSIGWVPGHSHQTE